MSTWSTVPLQSYELAQYAKPVRCYVCDGENRFDGAFCQQCHAPLAIGYSTDKKKQIPPQLVAVLGAAGVGKTCYLGLLMDMLSRHPAEMQLLARGAFSVSLQQQTMAALARREFPPPTPSDPAGWMWVHCAVRSQRSKRPLELILPDVSGATALQEIESPPAAPAIRRLLTNGTAAMILIDADELANGIQESEFFALKVVGDLLSGEPTKKSTGWSKRPVAIVFTKADRCDWAFESPDEFARRYVPGLWRQCREQLHGHRFFATSIASVATAVDAYGERLNLPLRIEPRGIVEPFAWLVEQLGAAAK